MRILAVLQNPGYLRHYGSVLVDLAGRGHEVQVAFTIDSRMREGLLSLEEADVSIPTTTGVPKRADFWSSFLVPLRQLSAYLRYLDPELEARYLRDRLDKLPRSLGFLRDVDRLPRWLLTPFLRLLVWAEQAAPSSAEHEAWLEERRPDVVFVSPVVQDLGQADVVKAAQRLGVPAVLGIASWDHLTTKGLISVRPDLVLVWNATQRTELERFHFLSGERVVLTGAQSFDPWFGRAPSRDRETFCRTVGLQADQPFFLYVGSFRTIADAASERRLFDHWVRALRARPGLEQVGVLMRPHPYNTEGWSQDAFAGHENLTIWSNAAYPVHEASRSAYFDSIHHCAAVIGINTSALIEAAIVERPVLALEMPEFADTQTATIHFRYLRVENGGFLKTAVDLEDAARQLEAILSDGDPDAEAARRFVSSFIRPNGLDAACVPLVANAIEQAGELRGQPSSQPAGRIVLLPAALLALLADAKRRRRFRKRVRSRIKRIRRPARRIIGLSRRRTRHALRRVGRIEPRAHDLVTRILRRPKPQS